MSESAGLILIILGGVMEGAFGAFMKKTPKWNWENIWGAGSLLALLLIPWSVALATIPGLWEVYDSSPPSSLLLVLLFGAGWGVGGVLFGLGLNALGLSIGLSLIMGLIAVNGSVIPFLTRQSAQDGSEASPRFIGGVAIMLLGLILCAVAGKRKSKEQSAGGTGSVGQARNYIRGLLFCIVSGILSALLNFGLIYGTAISDEAVRHGATATSSVNAVWALVFTSNYAVNIAYCAYLCWRNGSFDKFLSPGTGLYWGYAVLMGALWAGGIVIYGMGTKQIGALGAYIGLPIMLISSILTGNFLGYAGGEWKNSERWPRQIMAAGVGILIVAILVLGFANTARV